VRIGAVIGDVRRLLQAEVRAGERAATRAVREETDALKRELRGQVAAAFGTKGRGIASAWRSAIYPRFGVSLRPAGLVWSKTPVIVDAFERGALIRAKGSKFLAIPTGFNAARGHRGRGGKGLRVTPSQMAASGQAFLRPFRSGRGYVWCLPLRGATSLGNGRRPRRRTLLFAGGIAEVGTANRKGREAWARDMLRKGMVPMFILLPQVKLTKRLDVAGAAARAGARAPRRFVALWEAETGRAA
jgi:Family of unknown function (DUF6441)